MSDKKSFVMYKSWGPLFKGLPKEQAADLICAIYDYQTIGEHDLEDPTLLAIFDMIRQTMDEDAQKYAESVEQRTQAGIKSGEARRKKAEQKRTNVEVVEQNVRDRTVVQSVQQNERKPTKRTVSEYVSVSVSDSVSVNDNDSVSDVSSPNVEDTKVTMGITDVMPCTPQADYDALLRAYNQTCVSYPRINVMSDRRKKAIKARLRTGYTMADFETVFRKAEASDFLKGKNDRNWSATFDWMIKDANMAKILDGNYDNKASPAKQDQGSGNYFLDILNEMEGGGAP